MAVCGSAGLAAGAGRPGWTMRRARELARGGALGRVVLCRVGELPGGLELVHYVLGEAAGVIVALQAPGPAATFLGDRATLTVHADACRLYGSGGEPAVYRRPARAV